jgi:hypothetical protein
MKNIKALRKGFFVVLLLAGIASDALCIEPNPAQRVFPTVAPTVVTCPSQINYTANNMPSGWAGGAITMSLLNAEIQPVSGSYSLHCIYKYGNVSCNSTSGECISSGIGSGSVRLFRNAPTGSCKVNPDKRSFTCVQQIQ